MSIPKAYESSRLWSHGSTSVIEGSWGKSDARTMMRQEKETQKDVSIHGSDDRVLHPDRATASAYKCGFFVGAQEKHAKGKIFPQWHPLPWRCAGAVSVLLLTRHRIAYPSALTCGRNEG